MREKLLGPLALILTYLVVLWPATSLRGDDVFPPPWRGQPFTTLAEWDFLTPTNPTPPDGTLTPVIGDSGGGPIAEMESDLTWDPVFNGSWANQTPGGVNNLIFLDIPNWIDTLPVKLLQIQLTVQPNSMGEIPHVFDIVASDPQGVTEVTRLSTSVIPIGNPVDGLLHSTEVWRIRPNPDEETIGIEVPLDTLVSQIVVDTISTVPEPTGLALICATMLCLLLHRGWARR